MDTQNSKKHTIRNIIIVLVFIACLALLWRTNKTKAPTTDNNAVESEVAVLTVKTIKEQTPYTDINVQIPQFRNASSAFNGKIEKIITDIITEHKQETKENWQARLETQGPDENLPETPQDPANRMFLYSNFDLPEQNNNSYISVLMRYGGYTGGAHAYEEVVAFNYDVKNRREVELAELFPNDTEYLTTISNFTREVLIKRFSENIGDDFSSKAQKDSYIKNVIEPMVLDGTDPGKPENFANFTFTDKQITFHFSQYQVGPYVWGQQDVVMPR